MISRPIVPCLWCDADAEDAARLYVETFAKGRVVMTTRYPTTIDNPGNKPRGSVLTVEIEVAGQRFTLLNGGPQFKKNPSVSFFVHCETKPDVDRICAALAQGGTALMELDSYPWSERYAWIQDRFGTSWQVMLAPRKAGQDVIVPCLMFTGAQHGRAEEAMNLYASVFDGRIASIERYAAEEGPAGTVKHGRMVVAGQELVAMDSHMANEFGFNEAISLQVMCADQADIDRFWSALAAGGGEEGPCGWLKDRFGLSWQVAPTVMWTWLGGEETAAKDRAFAAMLKMKKLDIAALAAAFAGR